jgi:hypothetical protein
MRLIRLNKCDLISPIGWDKVLIYSVQISWPPLPTMCSRLQFSIVNHDLEFQEACSYSLERDLELQKRTIPSQELTDLISADAAVQTMLFVFFVVAICSVSSCTQFISFTSALKSDSRSVYGSRTNGIVFGLSIQVIYIGHHGKLSQRARAMTST